MKKDQPRIVSLSPNLVLRGRLNWLQRWDKRAQQFKPVDTLTLIWAITLRKSRSIENAGPSGGHGS